MESLDDGDLRVAQQLGIAVAHAQLLELQMVRLLEAQQHDLSVPLEDRWDEISGWLKLTAGKLARRLGVPETVAAELKALVDRRNRVVHQSWTAYVTARGVAQGEAAMDDWIA